MAAKQVYQLDEEATPAATDYTTNQDPGGSENVKKTLWSKIRDLFKVTYDTVYLALAGGTITGDIIFGENAALRLDPALSADGKYCGITEVVTAGETIAFGDLVYLKASDSQWYKTDADASSTSGAVRIGIAVSTGADNGAMTILTYGKIRADAKFPTLTVAAPVYISGTAGLITNTAPSATDAVVRIIGYGNDGNELFFCPSNDFITML